MNKAPTPILQVILCLLVCFACISIPTTAQVIECPPQTVFDCDETIPAPDPSVVNVVSYCRNANCCTNKIAPSEICASDESSCVKVALTCISSDNNCNPIFKFKVYNSCSSTLKKVAFTLPNGVSGTHPMGNTIYTSACGDQWSVYLPTGNGSDAGTIKFVGQLGAGLSTCFDITMMGMTKLPPKIELNAKYGATQEDELSVVTYGCGNAFTLSKSHKVDKVRNFGCVAQGICRIYEVEVDCPILLSGRRGCEAVLVKDDDYTPPTYSFTAPNKTIACDEPIIFETPSASDDCGAVTIESLGPVMTLGGCPGPTVYIKRWKARDECFNYAQTVEQRITVPANCCLGGTSPEDGYTSTSEDFSLNVAPNPTRGQFRIDMTGLNHTNARVAIFDLSGKLIYQADLSDSQVLTLFIQPAKLDMQAGIYLIKATNNDESPYATTDRTIISFGPKIISPFNFARCPILLAAGFFSLTAKQYIHEPQERHSF